MDRCETNPRQADDPGDAPPRRLRAIRYGPDLYEEEEIDAGAVGALLSRPGVCWFDLARPGPKELAELQRQLALHPLAVADAAHPPQRPRHSVWNGFELFVLEGPPGDGLEEQISLFVGDRWVLTVREAEADRFASVHERLRQAIGPIRSRSAAWLAAALATAVVDCFFEPLEDLRERIEQLEDAVLAGDREPRFHELHALRRRLLLVRRAVEPMHEALLGAQREETGRWDEEARIHLREAEGDALHLLESVEGAQNSAASLGDLYLSVIGSRTNEVVTLLTLVSTLFLPMTFLTGVWGMNFWFMPELRWRYGYLFAWTMIVASASALLFFMFRRGWFRAVRGPWGTSEIGGAQALSSRRRVRGRIRERRQ